MTAPKPPAVRFDGESGVILLSVLIVLALASAVLMLMLSVQDTAIARSIRFNEAAQALAYAKAGEVSAIVALRRDGIDAPKSDNLSEAWAHIADSGVAIENGTFTLTITDAQARFNINNLAALDLGGEAGFEAIVKALKLPPSVTVRVSAFLKAHGAVRSMADLAEAGLRAEDVAALETMATALPVKTDVNVNTAAEPLLSALFSNPPAVRQLMALRTRNGALSDADIGAARVILPPGVGFTSGFFQVDATVTVGDTAQGLSTLLQRTLEANEVRVAPIDRERK